MNTKQLFFGGLSIILVFFYSCSPTYVANTTNIPLLSGKGEFKANISSGTNDVEPQLTYAISNHIGLMANGSFRFREENSIHPKRNFFEGGIGYYNSPATYQILEIYGGYGMGYVSNNYNLVQSSDRFDANYQRFFLQPNIGFRSRYIEGGLSFRFSYLNIDKVMIDKSFSTQNFYFEPAVTLRGGFENFKVSMQFGLSKLIGSLDEQFDHQPFLFGVGLQFNFGGKKMAEID